MDDKLTILLTINRCPEYTFRWMTYNNKIRFPFKIVIADGGQDKTVFDILSNYKNFPNLDYKYVHYKESGRLSEFFYRVNHALTYVDTTYVLKAANDDFFLVEGIRKALSFLHTHPGYSSSRGEIYDFCVTGASEARYNSVYGYITYFKQFNPESSIVEDTAIKRIRHSCANICVAWYDIYRTDQLKKYHQILHKLNPADIFFNARITDFLTVAEGKINREDSLFMLHQANQLQGEAAAFFKQFPTYKSWMQSATWQRDFNNFIQAVAESVSVKDVISPEEAGRQFAEMFHKLYLAPRLAQDKQKGQNKSRPADFLKEPLKDIVQKLNYDHLIRKAFTATVSFRHRQISNSLLKSSKYRKDLDSIIKFLAKSPESVVYI